MHRISGWGRAAVVGLAAVIGGCGIIPAPLPNRVEGLTLGTIEQLQNDNTLDDDERAAILRAFLGLEEGSEADLITDFLTSLSLE